MPFEVLLRGHSVQSVASTPFPTTSEMNFCALTLFSCKEASLAQSVKCIPLRVASSRVSAFPMPVNARTREDFPAEGLPMMMYAFIGIAWLG